MCTFFVCLGVFFVVSTFFIKMKRMPLILNVGHSFPPCDHNQIIVFHQLRGSKQSVTATRFLQSGSSRCECLKQNSRQIRGTTCTLFKTLAMTLSQMLPSFKEKKLKKIKNKTYPVFVCSDQGTSSTSYFIFTLWYIEQNIYWIQPYQNFIYVV